MIRDSIPLTLNMDNANGYTDLDWAIGINRRMLKIIGLWPPDNQKARKVVKSKLRLLYNLITLLFILAIPTFIALIKIWGNMVLMIDRMMYNLTIWTAVLKVCIFSCKQEALAPIVNMVVKDWLKPKLKNERDIMLCFGNITRIISISGVIIVLFTIFICTVFSYFGLNIYVMTNSTNVERSLPIPAYYFYDTSRSPQFELMLLTQVVTLFTTCISNYAIDHFLGLLVLHVCGQMENLHSRLTHTAKYTNFDILLKYNVQEHIRLIRSIEIVDNSFFLMMFILILNFGITFCLQGFLIVNALNQKNEMPFIQFGWYVSATMCMLMHTCLYCAVGEILVTQSENLHRATYEYSWYTIDPKAAKNLMLIMLRASKPLHITAGKVVPMTMATFCNLLKTSAGYISVLLANQN